MALVIGDNLNSSTMLNAVRVGQPNLPSHRVYLERLTRHKNKLYRDLRDSVNCCGNEGDAGRY